MNQLIICGLILSTTLGIQAFAETTKVHAPEGQYEKLGVQKANKVYKLTADDLKKIDKQNVQAFKNSSPEVQKALIDAYNKTHPAEKIER